MAKKFSLKDNPIFQRLEAPEPREVEPPAAEALPAKDDSRSSDPQGVSHEHQPLTPRSRSSEIDPQKVTPSKPSERHAHVPALDAQAHSPQDPPSSQVLSLKDHMEEERQQIEEAKALLPPAILEELSQEARRLLEEESPNLKFGKELMIRIKLNELVKLRYLSSA